MSDQSPKGQWTPTSIAGALTAVLILYVLSIGPTYWLISTIPLPYAHTVLLVWWMFYYPLTTWLATNVEFVHEFLVWYLGLWGIV